MIPLVGPVAEAGAELSGLAWCERGLVLVPQFPHRLSIEQPALYLLPRPTLRRYLSGERGSPLRPEALALEPRDFAERLRGFDGLEALVVAGSRVFLLAEARVDGETTSYVVPGELTARAVRLAVDRAVALPSASRTRNLGYEALALCGGELLAFPEVGGEGTTSSSRVVQRLSLSLEPRAPLVMDELPYRLTDVTSPGEGEPMWVANYHMGPRSDGSSEYPLPSSDPIAARTGPGASQAGRDWVERLVPLSVSSGRVRLADQLPVLVALEGAQGRNWEGLVRYEEPGLDGFLAVTDRFPSTLLAYVPRLPSSRDEA